MRFCGVLMGAHFGAEPKNLSAVVYKKKLHIIIGNASYTTLMRALLFAILAVVRRCWSNRKVDTLGSSTCRFCQMVQINYVLLVTDSFKRLLFNQAPQKFGYYISIAQLIIN
jgi:hypothetical protein